MNTSEPVVQIGSCHHVALRCHDAQATIDFYTQILGMKFEIATRENLYRGKPFNYLHIFLRMRDGNFLSFFELPGYKDQVGDPNTPHWVQHFALRVDTVEEVEAAKAALLARGVHVDGPVVRPPFSSIYFSDPSGNRMEITAVGDMAGTRYAIDPKGAHAVLREWVKDRQGGALDNVVA